MTVWNRYLYEWVPTGFYAAIAIVFPLLALAVAPAF